MALSIFELYAGSDMIDSWTEGERCHSYQCAGEAVNHDLMLKIFDDHMAMSTEDELFSGELDTAVHQIIETTFVHSEDGSIIRCNDEASVLIQSTTAQWAMLRGEV